MQIGFCVSIVLGMFLVTVALDSQNIPTYKESYYRGRLRTFFLAQALVFTLLGPVCLCLYR